MILVVVYNNFEKVLPANGSIVQRFSMRILGNGRIVRSPWRGEIFNRAVNTLQKR